MNKDVIYIEPEDDITDILANIKSAKNKIIALVPPKKAGVLRSAVNFKLIAKTAAKTEKTIVLVTADESLKKLAATVKMPVAKTLQSKPQIPSLDDLKSSKTQIDVIEEEKKEEKEAVKGDTATDSPISDEQKAESEDASAPKNETKEEKGSSSEHVGGIKKVVKKDAISDDKKTKTAKDSKVKSVPNLKKFILPITIGVVLLIGGSIFLYWANVIAPAAAISIVVKTSPQNFSEAVTFVENQEQQDIKSGVFYVEQKTISKTAEVEFAATGEKNVGEKATGSIIVKRARGDKVDCNDVNFSIPEGTQVVINGKKFVTTNGSSVNPINGETTSVPNNGCKLSSDIQSEQINIIAVESGESYNVGGSGNVTLSINTSKGYTVQISEAISGGTDKKVKVVTEDDIKRAEESLSFATQTEIKNDLQLEFDTDYLLIDSSFKSEDGTSSVSPNKDEEVQDGVTPKYIKEKKYTIYAVRRKDVSEFIEAKVKANIGDNTQVVYSTGVSQYDKDNKTFIDGFKLDAMSGKLKSTVEIGPKVTEDDVYNKALGNKLGEVQASLKSINGVSKVNIDTSYFWVTKIPKDKTKVQVEIEQED